MHLVNLDLSHSQKQRPKTEVVLTTSPTWRACRSLAALMMQAKRAAGLQEMQHAFHRSMQHAAVMHALQDPHICNHSSAVYTYVGPR
jgi:hypothetical protein